MTLTRSPNRFADVPKGRACEVEPGWIAQLNIGRVMHWQEFLEPPVCAGQLRRAHRRLTVGAEL